MQPHKKPAKRTQREELRKSLWEKEAPIQFREFPPEFREVLKKKTAAVIRALHRFKPKTIAWGESKRHGAVEIDFVPVYGYKSQTRTEAQSEHHPNFRYFSADHIYGFKEWIGLAVRFMAYPSKAERAKLRSLVRLDEVVWPHDYVMDEYGSIGNIGGTITFAAKRSSTGTFAVEKRPTFFLQSIKIRNAYFDATKTPKWIKDKKEITDRRTIKRRYERWQRRWIEEIERQCRAIGFERIAWLTSSDAHFSHRDMRIRPETREALYKTLPASMHYHLERLWVPTNNGMVEVQYYCKRLH